MKKTAILFLMMSIGVFAFGQGKKTEEVQIKTTAKCGMCKQKIEKELSFEKGVKKSELDVANQMLTVTYDPKKTDVEKIKTAVSNTGYDADNVKGNKKAHDKLDGCCQKDSKENNGKKDGNKPEDNNGKKDEKKPEEDHSGHNH